MIVTLVGGPFDGREVELGDNPGPNILIPFSAPADSAADGHPLAFPFAALYRVDRATRTATYSGIEPRR